MTPQSVTLVIFKKDIAARHWPHLSTTVLPYVKTDFSRWTWEGDESDDLEEECSTDIINVDMDSSSVGTISEGLASQVFPLRTDFTVYTFANEKKVNSMLNPDQRYNAGNPTSPVGTAKFPD